MPAAVMEQMASVWQTVKSPPRYLVASCIVSVFGLLNGLDTGTIGPITAMTSFSTTFGPLTSTMHGLVVSSVLLTTTLASLFSGAVSDKIGRTRAIVIGGCLFAIGAAIEAGAVTLPMFIAGRCIVGLGQGTNFSTLVVYICEISPPSKRGPLASTVQLLICFGIMTGYFICYGTVNISTSLSWRLPLAFQAATAASGALASAFLLPPSPRWLTHKGRREEASAVWDLLGVSAAERASAFLLPPSPRWLAHKGRREEASAVWDLLGVSAAEREKDLLENPENLIIETNELNDLPAAHTTALDTSFLARLRRNYSRTASMFGKGARKQMMLGIFMMAMQQLSGIDGVLYYAPLLFQQAGISSAEASFLASGVSAILIFVSTIPAILMSDRWGRRASALYGGLVICASMALIGSLYASDSVHATTGSGRWVVIVTIYIFVLAYCMSWAVGFKIFACEIQPIRTRATATSLGQAANSITNFGVAFITPILLARSSSAIYFLFGGASALTLGVCAAYMPETKGKGLEEIEEAFRTHR
ncbi:hypothetical protein V495_05347, partial [Pseudogymnoascus sp. VKM F-4514 (FW-929)]